MSYVLSLTQFLVSAPSGTMNVFLSSGCPPFSQALSFLTHVILASETFQKLFLYRKKKETLCQNPKVANALSEPFNLKKKKKGKRKETVPFPLAARKEGKGLISEGPL